MKQYKILSISVIGKANKTLKAGQILPESSFSPTNIKRLIEQRFIEEYNEVVTLIPNDEKLKIAIVSAVWKRPEVFELFAKGIKILKQETPIEIIVIISGSEGERSKTMVEKHGFIYIEVPNEPLATKVNATTLKAKEMNVDFVLCIGSDDIITPELMKVYEKFMRKGYDYIGVLDFYFYSIVTKKAAYWAGYRDERRKGHTCGAGRLISKRLMNKWNWAPWEIKDSKVLDNSMQHKLKNTPHNLAIFTLKEYGVYALDIKSETNMTPYALWDNTKEIPVNELKKHFPYVCVE